MMSKQAAAQPKVVPTMIGVEMGMDSGEEAGTMGLGVSGTVVALVALPDAGGEVLATLVGGAAGGAVGGDAAAAAWHAGSVGEISHVGTD